MSEVVVRCRPNGPFVIEGPVKVIDQNGNAFVANSGKPVTALCRCGESKNKPFCDGSHKGCGFVAEETAPPTPVPQP
ncbi:MAG TPA: CDGSH iron-sulfur domain-containing protein [Pirellulales bacterium]|jgi:CDGSH-type Zn-finger protein|nr:CDGSH iron-sulfur domain-containing protein [Pirellulales bacterium]